MPAGTNSFVAPAITVVVFTRGRNTEDFSTTWRTLAQQDVAPADVWVSADAQFDKSSIPRQGECPGGKFRVSSAATDTDLLKRTTGACLLLVTAGDQLAINTVRRFGEFLAVYRDAILLYADDADANGRVKPKRAWTPHGLFSLPAPWHGLVFRREFLVQQWEHLLRDGALEPGTCLLHAGCTLPGCNVLHIPEILLKPGFSSAEVADYRHRVQLEWHRQGFVVDGDARPRPQGMPPVGIVMADRATDQELVHAATNLLQHAHVADIEVLISTTSKRQARLKRQLAGQNPRIRVTGLTTPSDPPGLPALYNAGAANLRQPLVVFVHPEVAPATSGWLTELVTALHFAAAAAAVPRLLDEQAKPLPASRFLGDRVAGISPPPAGLEPWDNVGAAHGVILAVRRSEFDAVGGFDERYTDAFFDLSFSLRLRARGGSIVLAERSRVKIPERLLDPVLRNDDAEVFVRDEAVALAPADRLLCTKPGLWESCSRARCTALQPEDAVSPDDPTAVAGWALEHNVTLSVPVATLDNVAEDLGFAAAYILQTRLEHPEWREEFPRALSEGPEGGFCARICKLAEEADKGALTVALRDVFAYDPGSRIRELFLQDATLRFFHPLGLLPEGCWRLAAWLLGEGRARHQVSSEEAWWFLITTHEEPERWLQDTLSLLENDPRGAPPPEPGLNIIESSLRNAPASRRLGETLAAMAGEIGTASTYLDDQSATRAEASVPRTSSEPYDVTFFTALESPAAVFSARHLAPHRDRYRIGCWNWPFGQLPADWASRLRGLDEIWAPTFFAESAARLQTSVPVHRFTLPCHVQPASPDRAGFDLPENAFIMLATCTNADDLERKNLTAVIRAFMQGFRRGDGAMLVFKTCGAASWDKRVQHVHALGTEAGVRWIDTPLPQARFQQLLASCDAYVSLHRCTSQGRVLAEAMQQGRPCVATNYGGHLDFMNELNSRLVSYRLRPAETPQIGGASGIEWASPDIQEAAHCLRWMFEDRDAARTMGLRGQADAQAHFDEKETARAIRSRLAAIRHERS